jgi:molybdopterin-guanine dinucleotide biosynthesis protein A
MVKAISIIITIMLTVAIQAGGESRRMGQEKALAPFLGQPLISRVLQRVASIADEVLVTTNTPQSYLFLNVPVYADLMPGRGALGGLFTALAVASYPMVAVVACDMPFVDPDLLCAEYRKMLNTQADVVIPQAKDGMQPFHAIYRRETCLPFVQSALDRGCWRVDAWFDQVLVHPFPEAELVKFDPSLHCFWNVNTIEELEAAERIATQSSEP